MLRGTPRPLASELERTLPERPFNLRFWDGTELPSTTGNGDAPTLTVRSRRAFGHALRAPGQIGLGRAYVTGEIEVDDLDKLAAVLREWSPPPIDGATKRRLALNAVKAAGLQLPPKAPEAELRPRGKRHSVERDARSVRHHYNVSNEFFALFLDESMTYSCAFFGDKLDDPAETLSSAQQRKLAITAGKLAFEKGERILDVGCGWGAFAIHAAKEHGVHVTGITLSEPQAQLGRERAAAAGVGDLVDLRVADYRELSGEQYDAIVSIGMVEHVGSVQIDAYAKGLADLLRPGGRVLNHGIARLRLGDPEAGGFSERYVFPDAAPLHLSRIITALERAGLEPDHVEGYRMHYARTLKEWVTNLESDLPRARALAGDERVRVWQLYLRAARSGFETGFMSIFQVRARKG